MDGALLVYCTFPTPEAAERIAHDVVEKRLAACVNIVSQVRSVYQWQGKVCKEDEYLAMLKTSVGRFEALKSRIVEQHPYDCPEVIAVEIKDGHEDYLQWVADETRPRD